MIFRAPIASARAFFSWRRPFPRAGKTLRLFSAARHFSRAFRIQYAMFVWKRSAIAAVAVAFALLLSMSFALATVSAASVPAAAFTVVLDAGHGGIDPGVLGVKTKTKESEINLKIVKKLEKQFISAGFRVVLTRKNGGGLYGLLPDCGRRSGGHRLSGHPAQQVPRQRRRPGGGWQRRVRT